MAVDKIDIQLTLKWRKALIFPLSSYIQSFSQKMGSNNIVGVESPLIWAVKSKNSLYQFYVAFACIAFFQIYPDKSRFGKLRIDISYE